MNFENLKKILSDILCEFLALITERGMIITIAFYCCVIFVTIFLGRERTKATIAVAEAQVKAAKRKRYNKLYETLTPYDVVFSYIQKRIK